MYFVFLWRRGGGGRYSPFELPWTQMCQELASPIKSIHCNIHAQFLVLLTTPIETRIHLPGFTHLAGPRCQPTCALCVWLGGNNKGVIGILFGLRKGAGDIRYLSLSAPRIQSRQEIKPDPSIHCEFFHAQDLVLCRPHRLLRNNLKQGGDIYFLCRGGTGAGKYPSSSSANTAVSRDSLANML